MFPDPIIIQADSTTSVSIPRVDAGNQSGSFIKRRDDVLSNLEIRNTTYTNKTYKRTMNRHNIEYAATKSVDATIISAASKQYVRAYIVIEHDDNAPLADIQAAADVVTSFVREELNSGFLAKLVNNEA